jgi:Flp pilus assembly protein TadD
MRASSQVHKSARLGWAAALLLVPVLAAAQQAPAAGPPPAPEQGAEQSAAPAAVPPATETAVAPAPQPAPAVPAPPAPPAGPAVRVLRTGGLKMETAALLLSGQQGGPLPFAVLAFPVTREGDMVRVPVLVEVDGAALLDEQQGNPLDLEVALYALGANGNVQAAVMETVEVDLDRLEPEVRRSGIKFFGELQLLPGDYSLRALVRNPATDNIGLRVVPLTVTGLEAEVRTVMAPMFAERSGAWLPVRALEMRNRTAPLAALAGDDLPAARPILVPEQDVTFQVAAYHLQEGLDLRMELRRPSGQLAADFPLQITGRQPAGPPGLEVLTASFKPHGVEPGEYDLRVVIPGAGNDFRSYPVSAVVAEQDVGGRVWAELSPSHKEERQAAAGAPGTPGAAPTASHPPRPKARGRVDTTPMENAYRDALRLLGTGDEKGARAAVSALETSVLVEQQTLSGPELGRAEYAVAHGLAQTQPEALIPVLLLHEQLYRDYLNRNVSMLYSHAREMTFILADLYVKQNNTPAARELAARFILGLASEFATTAPRVVRSRAFRKVLDFDSTNEAALLCLAIDAERNAEYQAAADYLGKLVQKNPKHAEGKVRLALNQARLGHRKDARRQFEEVIKDESGGAGAAPVWLLAVAYQELSRLLIDSEDYEAAERVLRAGLARLPEDEKLSLELALVLDQRKNRSESRAVLETVRPKTTPRGFDSARRRYTQLPVELLERERMGLQQSAAERLHSLAVAVPAGGAKGGLP